MASPLSEILDPFKHFFKVPAALQAVNVSYLIEGLCYFGIITLLAMSFNENVGLSDVQAGWVVGAFTGGITLSMFFLGEFADKYGVRRALLISLSLMAFGRVFLASAPLAGGSGAFSPAFFTAITGLLFVIIGYGMYMPGCYAAVRYYADEKAAPMGYAMLYALMNLGGFLPATFSPAVRHAHGISGVFWLYTALTVIGIGVLMVMFTKQREQEALARKAAEKSDKAEPVLPKAKTKRTLLQYLKEHPLSDVRFSFFIFVLIPVQTLFAHQWLTMPQYVARSYDGFVGQNFEVFVNINPLLIFVFTPIVAALTSKVNVYRMMILGTLIMAAPTFLLALGPSVPLLFTFIVISTIGEAMWQPRFLQLAAELAPEGKTGLYMGIAQFPWFMTKVLTGLYSGTLLQTYCPESGATDITTLWLINGGIAMMSPILLFAAKGWMGARLERKGKG